MTEDLLKIISACLPKRLAQAGLCVFVTALDWSPFLSSNMFSKVEAAKDRCYAEQKAETNVED